MGGAKGFPQERYDIPGTGRFHLLEDLVKLSAIEPETIPERAAINNHSGLFTQPDFVHFASADRTFPPGLVDFSLPGRQQVSWGHLGPPGNQGGDQKVQFTGIKPHPGTFQTVVQLNFPMLDHDHVFFVYGASHSIIPIFILLSV
jgi:hypothetical protein